jgi:hypothetical protein
MAIVVNGTVYTVVGDVDYIDLQILMADGVTPRSLGSATNIKVRLRNIVDDSTIVFSILNGAKVQIIDSDNGKIRVKQDGNEYSHQSEYRYYVDIIDALGPHAVPMRQDLRPPWIVAAKIEDDSPSSSPSASPSTSPSSSPS